MKYDLKHLVSRAALHSVAATHVQVVMFDADAVKNGISILPGGMFFEPSVKTFNKYEYGSGEDIAMILAKMLDERLMGWAPSKRTLVVVEFQKDVEVIDVETDRSPAEAMFAVNIAGPARILKEGDPLKVDFPIVETNPGVHLRKAIGFLRWALTYSKVFRSDMRIWMIRSAIQRVTIANVFLENLKMPMVGDPISESAHDHELEELIQSLTQVVVGQSDEDD